MCRVCVFKSHIIQVTHLPQIKRAALLSSGPPISLKVLYCLHALGIETDVLDLAAPSIAKHSRYRRRYQKLEPGASGSSFDADATGLSLAKYVRANDIDAVIGGDIYSTGVLNATKHWLPEAVIFPSSGFAKLEQLDDKWLFQQLMVAHGIPCPLSILLEKISNLESDVSSLTFPIIAKPLHGESSHGVVRLEDLSSLRRHLQSGSKYARLPLLLQEYVVGKDADISFLAHEGSIHCHVLHTRTNGCALEFLSNDSVLNVATQIAKASGFTGVANIDVRIDPSTNAVSVLECNPRFWYTLQASLWRGLNFVEAGLALARGDATVLDSPVDGVYYLHGCLLTQVLWSPNRWRTIKPYNLRGLFQALSDPMPFVALRL